MTQTAAHATRPWLKISFDYSMPGEALVSNYPRKRKKRVAGQWVVFDKDRGIGGLKEYTPAARLFSSPHIEACHAFIDAARS